LPTLAVASYHAPRARSGRIISMPLAATYQGLLQNELELDLPDAMRFPLSVMRPPSRS